VGAVSAISAVALVALAAGAATAQQPLFSTRVEAIRVDVLVTRGNRPVPGLRAEDFELRDNGVAQRVEVVSLEQLPLNVVLALDLSESVAGERLQDLRRASGLLLDALQPRDRAALLTFTEVIRLPCALTAGVDCIRRALSEPSAGGQTALIDGAYAGIVAGETTDGRALLMVFSDGLDTSSWLSAKSVLEATRRTEVVVYSIFTGGGTPPAFLRDLTDATGGRHIRPSRTADLPATFVDILNEFRHRYVLTYSPRGVSPDGWHALSVRIKRGGGNVKARAGYLARAAR
jgi:VWFA-related protein